MISLISSLFRFIWSRSRKSKLNRFLVNQIKACGQLHIDSETKVADCIEKILSLINEGKCSRIGRKYISNEVRQIIEMYFNSMKCILDVLSRNIDILEKLSEEDPDRLRVVYIVTKIYREKGYIDLGEFIKACPNEFSNIVEQASTKFIDKFEELTKKIKVKRISQRCYKKIGKTIYEEFLRVQRKLVRLSKEDEKIIDKILREKVKVYEKISSILSCLPQ